MKVEHQSYLIIVGNERAQNYIWLCQCYGYSKIWKLRTSKTFDRARCKHVPALFDHSISAHIDGRLITAGLSTYSKIEMLFDMAGIWFYLPDTNTSSYHHTNKRYILRYTHFVRVSIMFRSSPGGIVAAGIFEAKEFCFHTYYMGKHNYIVLPFFV